MDYLEYGEYKGTIEYSDEDSIWFGKVLDCEPNLVIYEGATLTELQKDFEEAIDGILDQS